MTDFLNLRKGASPLILSMPHGGHRLTAELEARLTEAVLATPDADWWIERLYDFAAEFEASVVRTRLSRYVIDVNRDPSGASLYPDRETTELCPTLSFDGEPLYKSDREPDAAEIEDRKQKYFAPYHAALQAEIDRVKGRHGFALLYDCHSIRSTVPRLFEGRLPVFNIGTNDGSSCAPGMEQAVAGACAAAKGFDHVVNGRFKGGWIIRHYGRPRDGVHAVQMELAQRAYMLEAPPWAFDHEKAVPLREVLKSVLRAILDWAQTNAGSTP
ncbi:MAG: N-formylglutamate deformylase [Kiloniellales bacterium]